MSQRYYSSTAVETTGTAGLSAIASTMTVAATTGWPTSYPFELTLDEDTASEELVLVSNVAGLTVTMSARGYDGTSAQSHTTGFTVKHSVSAVDYRDSRSHEAAVAGVHGVTGNVVGDTDAQVLSAKTLASPLVTGTFPVHAHGDGTSGGTIAPLTAHIAAVSGVHGVTGSVVGTSDTQTLDNKTLLSPFVQPDASSTKGLLVRGLVSQTDNLLETQISDGTPQVWVSAAGTLFSGTAFLADGQDPSLATMSAQAKSITSVAAVAKGFNGQTANILEVRDYLSQLLASVDPAGTVTTPKLVIKSAAGNALEIQNSSGVVLASFTPNGAYVPRTPGTDTWVTSNVTGIAAGTDVVSSPTITVDGQTPLKITIGWDNIGGPADGAVIHMKIMENVTDLRKISYRKNWATDGNAVIGGEISVVLSGGTIPPAGTHVYKFRAAVFTGTGTATLAASATSPAFIRVEEWR